MPEETEGVRQLRFERPSGATKLLLIRHGETVPAQPDAPFELVGGHGDPALDPRGVAQAERLAARLRHGHLGVPVDAIWVSNLRRTSQTAAPLANLLGLEMRVEKDLREVYLGEWEGGLYRVKVISGDPIVKEMWVQQRWDLIPGAERDEDFAARTKAATERIVAAHPDQTVAVVVHGGVIGQILATATGARPFTFVGVANGSISEMVVAGDQWILRSYNDVAHLDDAMAPAGG